MIQIPTTRRIPDNVVKKNYREDFKLSIDLPTSYNGEPFEVNVKAGGKSYHTEYDGTTYKSCKMVTNKQVMVMVDNHGLVPGLVYVEVMIYLEDTDMPDGNFRLATCEPAIVGTKQLYLWDGASETIEATQIEIEALADFIKGDTYKLTSADRTAIAAIACTDIVDSTLKVSGKAADARETGEEIRLLKNRLSVLESRLGGSLYILKNS